MLFLVYTKSMLHAIKRPKMIKGKKKKKLDLRTQFQLRNKLTLSVFV